MKRELNMLLELYYENTKKNNVRNFLEDGSFKISHIKKL